MSDAASEIHSQRETIAIVAIVVDLTLGDHVRGTIRVRTYDDGPGMWITITCSPEGSVRLTQDDVRTLCQVDIPPERRRP